MAAEKGVRRGAPSDDMVVTWAAECNHNAALVQPDVKDGEAIIFDGRLWHGSEHKAANQRIALLFQYTIDGAPVLMPDFTQLEWPFRNEPDHVPLALVSGSIGTTSRFVKPPEAEEEKISDQVHALKLPLPENQISRWQPYHLFSGAARNASVISVHASVLSPGHSPHPPHVHREEEILIVLDGEAELVIPECPEDANPRVEQLREGSFVFYPAYQAHTIRNSIGKPITYLMFKWRGAPIETTGPLVTTIKRLEAAPATSHIPFSATTLLDGPTAYLTKLHSHLTILQPGSGYAAHADEHDVAIVVLGGRVETMGRTVEPHEVISTPRVRCTI